MEKEHDKIGTRLELIITKLNNGERFTAEELADEFNVNVRTIQRDLNKRLSYIPLQKEQNYYFLSPHALGKLSYKDIQFCSLYLENAFSKLNELYCISIYSKTPPCFS